MHAMHCASKCGPQYLQRIPGKQRAVARYGSPGAISRDGKIQEEVRSRAENRLNEMGA
jgi:hypothetical protein